MTMRRFQIPTSVRLSEPTKKLFEKIKLKTGISNWNTLARIALLYAIKNQTPLLPSAELQVSNVEMSWRTFTKDPAMASLIADFVIKNQDEFDRFSNSEKFVTALIDRGAETLYIHIRTGNMLANLIRKVINA